MRLWTIHPSQLDAKGLTALWREALLAQKVLEGKTKGYRNHPQLIRFQELSEPLNAISYYLLEVWEEACRRGYSFNKEKIRPPSSPPAGINETEGQLLFEWEHLKKKLRGRDPRKAEESEAAVIPQVHPLFRIIPGERRSWEKTVEENKEAL